MPNFACPQPVRSWFQTDPAALEQQLNQIFTAPPQIPPPHVTHWLVRFAHHSLMPSPTLSLDSTAVQHRVWIAFALRYLHPLLTQDDHLTHHEVVTRIIKNHLDLVQQLVHGDVDTIIQTLQQLLPAVTAAPDPNQYPEYLHKIASREERTFARSAERGREQLITSLLGFLQRENYNPVTEVLRTYFSRKQTVAVHRALRAHHQQYRRLLRQSADDSPWQHDIALSLSEFDRRLDMIDEFRVWDLRILLGIEMGMVALVLWMDLTLRTKSLLIILLGLIIACLFYTRITYAITDAITWADKELRLLAIQREEAE